MILSGCLFCLLYFSHIQGHMALPRDRLLGLSHRDRSLCHLVASDPSARSLSFLAQLGGFHNGMVLFQTSWSWQGHLEQCITWEEERITRAYLAFCLEKWTKPGARGTFLTAWDSQLEGDMRHLEEWGLNCSSPLASTAAPGLWGNSPASAGRLHRARRSASPAPVGNLYTGTRSWFLPDPTAAADQLTGARRSRRGWTLPGTIWCGAGDSAENFTDLGLFDRTDLCCREHDHCEHKISAFAYNYGMRNFRLHTISHCDCDYSCNATGLVPQAILHHQSKYNYSQPISQMESGPKSTSSPVATSRQNQMATSLNLLPNSIQRMKRKNKKKCQKSNGHRRRKTKVPSKNTLRMREEMMSTTAHNETGFNPALEQNLMENPFPVELGEKDVPRKLLQRNASNALNSQVKGSIAIGWHEKISKEHYLTVLGEPSLPKNVGSTLSSNQNVTLPLIMRDKSIVKNKVDNSFSIPSREKFNLSRFSKNKRLKSLPNPMDRKGLASVNPECGIGNMSCSGIIGSSSCVRQSLDPAGRRWTKDKGNSRSCNCYKPLDRCKHKISPQEFKFSYYNQEHKTLYHCDCTKRLAKRMRRVKVKPVAQQLLEFVSASCFRLRSVLRNCSKGERRLCEKQLRSTVAVLSKPQHLQKILKVQRSVDESLYPLTEQQERGINGTSVGTNSDKLYNKCLQITQALTVKT
ncbi:group 3 secretory phospholipase A2 isoform X2 [Scyliorhinus torazame]|uniref:group 3 secretory phospholipase A2 isoform X2 n=1 Tax=Scyliorhinus torazame TaxID=75743 RepID=UPI003B5CCAEE